MSSIKLVAHRGYQRLFPENTLLAYQEAIKAGARFIETDVQLSADEQPVLYHDRKLKRCTGLKGAVHNHRLTSLSQAPNHEPKRLGECFIGQSIETLSDFIELLSKHPQVHAFIEVKSITIDFHGIDKTYRHITEILASVAAQCTLISFHIPFMTFARRSGWHSIGVALRRWKDLHKTEVETMAPDYIFADVDDLPKKINFYDFKSKLVVYEVDSPELARSLQQRGIEYIETFAIGDMRQALTS
jgi:glycerophosphoryl diester phosphodiesterase